MFRWIILAKAEETIVMKHALKNTTAVLRGLAAGNLTDIASLLSGAYAEVSSISSLLLGVQKTRLGDHLSFGIFQYFPPEILGNKIPKLEPLFDAGSKFTRSGLQV